MRSEAVVSTSASSMRAGVLVLDGFGIRVTVSRKHLVATDGVGRDRRWGRFARATAGLRRVVVLGRSGMITFEALQWLNDVGAGFLQIDRGGDLIACWGPRGLNDSRLRRAQAMAMTGPVGIEIVRFLLLKKLRGELTVLEKIDGSDDGQKEVRAALATVEGATSLDALMIAEARAAIAYWNQWTKVPVVFARGDLPKIPDHWRSFGQRGSPLTGSPRLAISPVSATLNYLYAILEAETCIACTAVGLDPGMGILHADQRSRDSMALDVLEGVRPEVDAFVLELLKTRVFRAADFYETPRGQCRILPPLTHSLSETAQIWEKRVAPVVEGVTKMLASSSPRIIRIPSPLTQSNRSAGRSAFKRKPASSRPRIQPRLPNTCRLCGKDLLSPRRFFCDECLMIYQQEKLTRFLAGGAIAIARLAAQGRDPAHGGEAARQRGETNIKRMREASEWERTHFQRPSPEHFKREVLPHVQGVPLRKMMKATGLSLRYCWLIRRGLYTPHPRHWTALTKMDLSLRSRP